MNIIYISLLPVVLLILFIYKKDNHKESRKLLTKGLLFGIVSALLAGVLEFPLDYIGGILFGKAPIISSLYRAFIVAAIPEECCKLLMLWLLLRNNEYFNEYFDGIVYAVCIGLGFAGLENIEYVFAASVNNGGNYMQVGFARAIMAVPGHYAFAVAMGFFYSLYHFAPQYYSKWKSCILLVPVVMHGIYDSLCFLAQEFNNAFSVLIALALIGFVIWMHRLCYRKLLALRQKDLDMEHISLFHNKMTK